MKRLKRTIALLLAALLLAAAFAGCSQQPAEDGTVGQSTPDLNSSSEYISDYTDRDLDPSWDSASAVYIELADGASKVSGTGANVTGDVVTITAEGTYVLSGSLSNGQVVVDTTSETKVQVVLNGVTIHNETGAAIYVASADKVFLTLEEGSVNTVSDGANYVFADGEDEPYAAVFSKDDLTINGAGALNVTGHYRIGIASKDDLVITGGVITVTAVGHGLRGRDCVKIWDVDLTVNAGSDGIQASNDTDETLGYVYIDGGSYTINAGYDGIQAETYLRVTGGSGSITAGGGSENAAETQGQDDFGMGEFANGERPEGLTPGGQTTGTTAEAMSASATTETETETETEDTTISTKGIKSGTEMFIAGGSFSLDTADDALHCNGSIRVTGGSYNIETGDDAAHADEALVIDAGELTITECYEGLEGKNITLNAGTIEITSSDDGINAAGGSDGSGFGAMGGGYTLDSTDDMFIEINGGIIVIDAGNDGVDSNGDIIMTGGIVLSSSSGTNSAEFALDYDMGEATITGGVFIGAGLSGMAQGFSDSSSQYNLLYSLGSNQAAGTSITLIDSSGEVVAHFTPQKSYNTVLFSVAAMKDGESYTIVAGATAADADEYGFAQSGGYSGGTQLAEVTLSGITTSNAANNGGGGGGFGGQQGGGQQGGWGGRP